MYRSILLAVDSSHYSEVCTRYALEYARFLQAKVTILNVLDRKEFAIIYPYYYPSADFPPVFDEAAFENNELYEKQKKRANELLTRIEDECRKMDVKYSCILREGVVPDAILEEAQCCDLVFLGKRGAGAEYNTGLLGSNLESVVRRCNLPIIVTPKSYRNLQKVLICYDGSEFAIKALRAASHLYESNHEACISMTLLVVHPSEEEGRKILQKAEQYLDAFPFKKDFIQKSGDPVQQILSTVEREDIDLIAMGAYGHSRIRELVLGSITESLLRQLKRAVMLHH
jgi:nucleotide-binding universal stress UspA family protein